MAGGEVRVVAAGVVAVAADEGAAVVPTAPRGDGGTAAVLVPVFGDGREVVANDGRTMARAGLGAAEVAAGVSAAVVAGAAALALANCCCACCKAAVVVASFALMA